MKDCRKEETKKVYRKMLDIVQVKKRGNKFELQSDTIYWWFDKNFAQKLCLWLRFLRIFYAKFKKTTRYLKNEKHQSLRVQQYFYASKDQNLQQFFSKKENIEKSSKVRYLSQNLVRICPYQIIFIRSEKI